MEQKTLEIVNPSIYTACSLALRTKDTTPFKHVFATIINFAALTVNGILKQVEGFILLKLHAHVSRYSRRYNV